MKVSFFDYNLQKTACGTISDTPTRTVYDRSINKTHCLVGTQKLENRKKGPFLTKTENEEWYGVLLYTKQNIHTFPTIYKNNHANSTIQLCCKLGTFFS